MHTFPIRVDGTEWAFCSALCRDAHQVAHELAILNIMDEMRDRVRNGGPVVPKGMQVKDISGHDLENKTFAVMVLLEPAPLPVDLELDDEEASG